jgi:D-glycero-D-manno-heptose 1,7-bisphosphate phosphatase
MIPRRYVLLDRDGTVIVERHYLADPEQVELLPNAAAGLRMMQALGYGLLIITNQSGIGRGYFDEACLARIHQRMYDLLCAEQITLNGIYYCPHAPDVQCACRKPLPGLVEQAARELGFEPSACVMIGDKAADIELGQRIQAVTMLVRTGYGKQEEAKASLHPDYIVDDLGAAALVLRNLDKDKDVS